MVLKQQELISAGGDLNMITNANIKPIIDVTPSES